MTSQGGSNGDTPTPPPPSSFSSLLRPSAGPKLQVQRSLSRDTITIHFSAQGKEEEEEDEELYGLAVSSSGLDGDDQGIVTAMEASEELLFEGAGMGTDSGVLPVSSAMVSSLPVTHTLSSALAIQPPSSSLPSSTSSVCSPASSSWPSEHQRPQPPPLTTYSSSSTSSPAKSSAVHSKPFLSLVKSLSTEVEPREGSVSTPAPQPMRHRHLMKTLVKSLSTDTARPEQEIPSHRLPDSRLNLHLFKPFTQPRVTAPPGGDSKTAPSSPLTSPDGRSFFKVQEVEARIEDTKRRLSEVMCEPLQLLSKIIGEEGGSTTTSASTTGMTTGIHRPKSLSTSATELSNLATLNGHLESNSDYCIKEEEDVEGDSPLAGADPLPALPRSPSLGLDRCFMSALARQEDEEFCELYSEDFELCTDTEADAEPADSALLHRGSTAGSEEPTEGEEEGEEEEEDEPLGIPHNGLILLISVVYGYFVLPLPTYVGGVLLGVAAGFMLAILVLWLSAPRRPSWGPCFSRCRRERWTVVPLDIKEPGIYKGWMNEIHSYDPETYHATLTHSVYVRLEGSVLRLSKPNRNIPRRASFNETKPDVTYISQKIYDLTNSKIYLVPHSLARKRVWNKKYPICIELAKQDDFMSKAQGDRTEAAEEKPPAVVEKAEGLGGGEENKRSSADPVLYLFGRTGREKEEWFRRMLLASRLKAEIKKPPSLPASFLPSHGRGSSQSGALSDSRSSSRGSLDDLLQSQSRQKDVGTGAKQKDLDYNVYMAKYISHFSGSPAVSPVHSTDSSPRTVKKFPDGLSAEAASEAWVNALLGRIFWDFLREKYWADVVSKKIQMKLSKIRLPYFMNELTLTELDMGMAIPKILRSSKPSVDHQGLWFDLEISYNGSFLMTLETKMNLARLGKEGEGLGEQGKEGPRPRTYCLADSDEESSSAGSSDEEDPAEVPEVPGVEGYVGGHRPSKIMRFVDKIAKSKYFQKATETEFIKKKMEEVSNTPLLLTVEVQECRGTLAVNIPPPPTDRIWYGFRRPPHLELKARPKLGEREVTFAHVTDWIEKKLDQEFQKIFVMPNMDDVWLPIMHSAMDTRSSVNLVTVTTDALKGSRTCTLQFGTG
ncbi:hypothetical protein AOLI_G00165670 [Acnodon oligacanthus]